MWNFAIKNGNTKKKSNLSYGQISMIPAGVVWKPNPSFVRENISNRRNAIVYKWNIKNINQKYCPQADRERKEKCVNRELNPDLYLGRVES